MNDKCILPQCGRSCSVDGLTHFVTRLEFVEGDILRHLEDSRSKTLHQLMQDLDWEVCIVSMALGSLIREGLVQIHEDGEEVVITLSGELAGV